MATIDYDQVNKAFPDGTHALQDFSLSIRDGEFMVLVGPSGCGKSTALRLLAGLEEATSGAIRIGDRVVNDLTPQERDIAMVFQNYALYPHMTVQGNLAFPLRMAGWPADRLRARVAETARLLGLEALLGRRPAELSGGQRQRAAMGRALVREPAVFLLDEPLSNLDAQLRGQMRREITALQERLRTTTIYVTHDQVEAMTMGSRLAVMNRGRLQQVGSPREIYERPANVFVATFVGSPRMNLFAGALVPAPGGRLACRLGGAVLTLTDAWQERLSAAPVASGMPVVVGLRPEAFLADVTAPGPRLDARVLAVEPMGHEQIVHFDAGLDPGFAGERGPEPAGGAAADAGFSARLPSRLRAGVGEIIPFAVDLSQLHLFDAQGQALGWTDTGGVR